MDPISRFLSERLSIPLPTVLAGPIIRRATPERVHFWIATSRPLQNPGVHIADFETGAPRLLPTRPSKPVVSVQLGERLFVSLLKAEPVGQAHWPTNEVLGYDIVESFKGGQSSLLEETIDLSFHGRGLPTFVLQVAAGLELRALYGSCRKLHGPDLDLIKGAHQALENARKLKERPTVLFLGGDQIYADDVSEFLIDWIKSLGITLVGRAEKIPGLPPLHTIPRGGRGEVLKRNAHFTSGEMHNHLLTFGEYAAMYLLAWNSQLWPPNFPDIFSKKAEINRQRKSVDRGPQDAQFAQRVMANMITYMTFDDHEITDDWFLNDAWKEEVLDTEAGRRVIANGLAAYWAFQALGNNPDDYPDWFVERMGDFLNRGENSHLFELTLMDHEKWSYLAPTSPPALVLNTRTRRSSPLKIIDRVFRSHIDHRLFDEAEKERLVKLLKEGAHSDEPLIVVIATPIFNLGVIEWLQERVLIPDEMVDAEGWSVNPSSILDLLDVVSGVNPRPVVVLCGDVHYGFEIVAKANSPRATIKMLQFCSSATKNHPMGGLEGALKRINGTLKNSERTWRKRQKAIGYWRGGAQTVVEEYTLEDHERGHFPDYVVTHRFEFRDDPNHAWPIDYTNNFGEIVMSAQNVKHRFYHRAKDGNITTTHYREWDVNRWPLEELYSTT